MHLRVVEMMGERDGPAVSNAGLLLRWTAWGRAGLGAGVWANSRAGMAAMQLAPPPWQDPKAMLAMDLGFHLVYGFTAAAAFRALA